MGVSKLITSALAGQTAAEFAAVGDKCAQFRQYDRAIEAYRKATTRIPLGTEASGIYAADVHVAIGNALLGRAEVAHSQGEGSGQVQRMQLEAAEEFRQAVQINERHCEAHYNLGTLLYALGDIAGAESHLLSAVSWNHDFVAARINLAVVFAEQGEGAAAKV